MILVHLARGFEEVEAVTVVDILRRAGMDAHFVSLTTTREVVGAHGITIDADYMYQDIDYDYCEMLILPGGMDGAVNMLHHKGICSKVKKFARDGRGIAAICAAPMVLGELGVLENRKATIYPGMEDKLKGAEYIDIPVVRDINIITSQGPGTAMQFALAIVGFFKGEEAAEIIAEGLLLDI